LIAIRSADAMDEIMGTTIDLLSGEHGIGLEKQRFIGRALEPAADLVKKIKFLFDPNNVMREERSVEV
jgi:FAD/FMN-containing dehydrogenase